MGETAESVAERWGVSRERQDAFALKSQQRAVAAIEAGRFDDQIVPVEVVGRKGETIVVDRDEHPRADSTAEALARLKPAFKRDGGSVTAGNSSGHNDGASAVLLVEAGRALALGLTPARAPPYRPMGVRTASTIQASRRGRCWSRVMPGL